MPSALAMLPLLLAVDTEATCESVRQCNELGTAAYKAGRFDEAALLFDRQIDYADTALEEAESATPAQQKARDAAVNNAVLAQLRAGHCMKARAYLDLADAESTATQVNRQQLDLRCSTAAKPGDVRTGTFWQYVGHGSWNQVTLQPLDGGKVRLDAFWMRISRGPLDEWGPAAFGALEEITLTADGDTLSGRFEGNDGELSCDVAIVHSAQAIEVTVTEGDNCATGGAGAYFGGPYLRVEDAR